MLQIIEAQTTHYDAIWEIFHAIAKLGDTYTYTAETTKEEALNLWCGPQVQTFVALWDDKVVGTYIMRPNYSGLGSHVANCSYMVSNQARGLGVGKAMAENSLRHAKELGYTGMQFNLVVSTNQRAVKLWKALGFEIVGTAPKAFNHKNLGLVDAYIMYKEL
jgi:L-amino acid N-acyltransferase YncA